jgi:hypothetical protein
MIASTLFVRVVPQDKDRGYMLLAGFEPKMVQSNCANYTTLNDISRRVLDEAIERMKQSFGAKEVKDATPDALKRKLAKMFGEV